MSEVVGGPHRLGNLDTGEENRVVAALEHPGDQIFLVHPEPHRNPAPAEVDGERRAPGPAPDDRDRLRLQRGWPPRFDARAPRRGSVPARILAKLPRCRHAMRAKTATAAATALREAPASSVAIGSVVAPATELRETKRVAARVEENTRSDAAVAIGASTANAPSAVATPLPPRPASHGVNTWPSTAQSAAGAAAPSPNSQPASSTAAAPFPASSSSAATAQAVLPDRARLVAPGLPLPSSRRSRPVAARCSSQAKGTVPSAAPTVAPASAAVTRPSRSSRERTLLRGSASRRGPGRFDRERRAPPRTSRNRRCRRRPAERPVSCS